MLLCVTRAIPELRQHACKLHFDKHGKLARPFCCQPSEETTACAHARHWQGVENGHSRAVARHTRKTDRGTVTSVQESSCTNALNDAECAKFQRGGHHGSQARSRTSQTEATRADKPSVRAKCSVQAGPILHQEEEARRIITHLKRPALRAASVSHEKGGRRRISSRMKSGTSQEQSHSGHEQGVFWNEQAVIGNEVRGGSQVTCFGAVFANVRDTNVTAGKGNQRQAGGMLDTTGLLQLRGRAQGPVFLEPDLKQAKSSVTRNRSSNNENNNGKQSNPPKKPETAIMLAITRAAVLLAVVLLAVVHQAPADLVTTIVTTTMNSCACTNESLYSANERIAACRKEVLIETIDSIINATFDDRLVALERAAYIYPCVADAAEGSEPVTLTSNVSSLVRTLCENDVDKFSMSLAANSGYNIYIAPSGPSTLSCIQPYVDFHFSITTNGPNITAGENLVYGLHTYHSPQTVLMNASTTVEVPCPYTVTLYGPLI
ncbi:uncharacterized protein MONBRDRAFT_37815 [Monosiga brevicollis MX1]|uniref:Uncharacterized protein n=1 Tax=Monosiga brevicollis TaxID=81824 RepID=A9V3K6_MONBE|nr:uncharacterized protein MONBRDRAFT_37815 [Monosiga brevicollis MX1]EDQ87830.1 predicted protein [Monosiga brevicollis MX1]|eukprot:XP_001747363.1 hypothetical protein [Monosiga brevicollis MX1]